MDMRRIALGLLLALLLPGEAEAQSQPPQAGWIADKNGCRLWDPYPQPDESISWSGACKDGYANGNGAAQWFEGGQPSDRYEGEYANGHSNGYGVYSWAQGDRYEGEFKAGVISGRGARTKANGGRYEGEFRDGIENGRGT